MLYINQWRAVTSETGRAVGMPMLVMQLGILWVGQKIVWHSKTSTNFLSQNHDVFQKKKDLRLGSASHFSNFVLKQWCPLLS